jgi:ABC-type dipeptide/oligopeptide/nickel transport system permease component
MLQGVVIIFTLMYVAAALLVDVLYAYIDPRIRYV